MMNRLKIVLMLGILWGHQTLAQVIPDEGNIPENVTVAVEDQTPDEKIESRLNLIYEQLEGLEKVEIRVSSGVVTLTGLVPDSRAKQDAVALAKNTEGVNYVSDRLADDVELSNRLAPATRKTKEMFRELIRKGPVFLLALAVVIAAFLIARTVGSGQWLWRRFGMRELTANLANRILRLVIIACGFLLALEILDATALASAILGVAGVAGIALGFAFRNIVENYLAGVLLSMRNPFGTGDAIEIEGYLGKIVMLTSRDTVLMTMDGNHVRIPNSTMMTSALTNFSRNPLRRFEFAIGVSVELDLTRVKALGMETLEQCPGVLANPGPLIVIEALGDSTVNMRFFAWINQTESDFLKTKSEAIRLVKVAFDDAEVEMPEPIYRLVIRGNESGVGLPPSGNDKSSESSEKSLKRVPGSVENHVEDTSADTTIDKQVHLELSEQSDENLLSGKG